MAISDMIAGFILQVLEGTDGVAELQRSELAQRFNCVPSQINYVISTRFSPEHGYIVESRRGGGGYIRIRRVQYEPSRLAMHTVNAIGYELDEATASALISNLIYNGTIDEATGRIFMAAVSEKALKPLSSTSRRVVRASILKQMLLSIQI
jgi:transcriptional regulator CtsR